jgi:hypothetical protein
VLTSSLTVSLGADGTGSHAPGDSAALAAGRSIDEGNLGHGSGQILDRGPELWGDDGSSIPATGGELQNGVPEDASLPSVSGLPASWDDHRHREESSEEEPDFLSREEEADRPNKRKKKNTKASIRVATLNMKGFQAADPLNPGIKINKWNHINQIMRENNIAILALQETHLTEERKNEIERLFPKLLIVSSHDRNNPSGRAGIALVLHRDKTLTESIEMSEIKQGRAMIVRTRWHTNDRPLSILAIYAPNDGIESESFFLEVKDYMEN